MTPNQAGKLLMTFVALLLLSCLCSFIFVYLFGEPIVRWLRETVAQVSDRQIVNLMLMGWGFGIVLCLFLMGLIRYWQTRPPIGSNKG